MLALRGGWRGKKSRRGSCCWERGSAVDYKSSLGEGYLPGPQDSTGFYHLCVFQSLLQKKIGHHGNRAGCDWLQLGSSVGMEGLAAPAAVLAPTVALPSSAAEHWIALAPFWDGWRHQLHSSVPKTPGGRVPEISGAVYNLWAGMYCFSHNPWINSSIK